MFRWMTWTLLLSTCAPALSFTGRLGHNGRVQNVSLTMCTTEQPDGALETLHKQLHAQRKLRGVHRPRDSQQYQVDTWFHYVVTEGQAASFTPEARSQWADAQVSTAATVKS